MLPYKLISNYNKKKAITTVGLMSFPDVKFLTPETASPHPFRPLLQKVEF
jgi:hypothetical protein